jgi:predicted RNA binding protein YcfA (HicA-like mRNA interferase family)
MKIPRDVAGIALAKVLCQRWDYSIVHQSGSHIILETSEPSSHRIAIPAHRSLRIGTLNAILRSVSQHKGIRREDILNAL